MSFRENYKKKKDEEETTTSSGTFRRAYRKAIEEGTDVEWTPTSPTYTTSQAQPTEPEEKKKSIWETVKGYAKDVVSGKVKERNKELLKKEEEQKHQLPIGDIVKSVGKEAISSTGRGLARLAGLGVAYAPEKGGVTEEEKKRAEELQKKTGAAVDTSEKNIVKRQALGGVETVATFGGGIKGAKGAISAVKTVAKSTAKKEAAKRVAKEVAKEAGKTSFTEGIYGGAYGAATGLEEEKPTVKNVLKDTAIGAGTGILAGGILSGAGVIGGKIINKTVTKRAAKIAEEVAELNKKADIGTAAEAGFRTKEVGAKAPVTSTVVKKELPEVVKEVTPQTITIDQAADKILQASEGISKTKNVAKINKILKSVGVEKEDIPGISKLLKSTNKRADVTKLLDNYNTFATQRAKKLGTKPPEIREAEVMKPTEPVTPTTELPAEGIKPSATPETAPTGIVEPTGKPLKPSKYAERVKAEAIEKGIKRDFTEIAGHEPQVVKEQIKRSADLINTDFERANRIIEGKEPAPEGLSGTYLMRAMAEYGTETGDSELIERLVKSPLASETSRFGSEISMLRGTANNPVETIKGLNKTLVENAGGQKKVNELVSKEKTSLKRLVDSETIKGTKEWSGILDQLRC